MAEYTGACLEARHALARSLILNLNSHFKGINVDIFTRLLALIHEFSGLPPQPGFSESYDSEPREPMSEYCLNSVPQIARLKDQERLRCINAIGPLLHQDRHWVLQEGAASAIEAIDGLKDDTRTMK